MKATTDINTDAVKERRKHEQEGIDVKLKRTCISVVNSHSAALTGPPRIRLQSACRQEQA